MELHSLFVLLSAKAEQLYTPSTLAKLVDEQHAPTIRKNLADFVRIAGMDHFAFQKRRTLQGKQVQEGEQERQRRLQEGYGRLAPFLQVGSLVGANGRTYQAYSGMCWIASARENHLSIAVRLGVLVSCMEEGCFYSLEDVVAWFQESVADSLIARFVHRSYPQRQVLSGSEWSALIPCCARGQLQEAMRNENHPLWLCVADLKIQMLSQAVEQWKAEQEDTAKTVSIKRIASNTRFSLVKGLAWGSSLFALVVFAIFFFDHPPVQTIERVQVPIKDVPLDPIPHPHLSYEAFEEIKEEALTSPYLFP